MWSKKSQNLAERSLWTTPYLDISGNAAAAAPANTATGAAPCGPVAGDSSDDRSTWHS